MVKEDEPEFPGYVLDISRHKYKELYYKEYTELIIHFEAEKTADNMAVALKAMHHFVNSYRVVADDVLTLTIDKITYLAKVYREHFHPYSPEELVMPEQQR